MCGSYGTCLDCVLPETAAGSSHCWDGISSVFGNSKYPVTYCFNSFAVVKDSALGSKQLIDDV